jgi:transglutaminase-like putative cysteine protease
MDKPVNTMAMTEDIFTAKGSVNIYYRPYSANGTKSSLIRPSQTEAINSEGCDGVLKYRLKLLGIIMLFLMMISGGWHLASQYRTADGVQYRVSAHHLDQEVLDSYPQEVTAVDPGMINIYHVRVKNSQDAFNTVVTGETYPPEVQIYLAPSAKIESDHPEIKAVAAEIAAGKDDPVAIAQAAAAWTARIVRYDPDLADRIWKGESQTRSALETLRQKRGTCSEYANLFIAIMRSEGIPARFITGRIYEGSYHAWAEIWLAGQGWVPVETQKGQLGVSTRHIKLLAGRDFVDIGVPLQNISARIRRVY